MTNSNQVTTIIRHLDTGAVCCDPDWEAAYKRFETPEQEIEKFVRRLRAFGLDQTPKDARIVELFCGRGGGLVALERLGFTNLDGVDLSDTLLDQYRGSATLHLADCRRLPLNDRSFDAAIVHGGLHHLPNLPDDLNAVLKEVQRVLQPDGTLYVVEPWLTPFLRFVHAVVQQPLVRKIYSKGDALATMIDRERETYEQWLSQGNRVRASFQQCFETKAERAAWGKWIFAGRPRRS